MIGFKDIIVPYTGEYYGSGNRRDVLMLQNDRDRSFFESQTFTGDNRHEQAIRTMREQGGVDISGSRIIDLSYVASRPDFPGIYWMAVEISQEAMENARAAGGIGDVLAVSLLGVWSELWQIPDTKKGVPLANYWEMHILPDLKSL